MWDRKNSQTHIHLTFELVLLSAWLLATPFLVLSQRCGQVVIFSLFFPFLLQCNLLAFFAACIPYCFVKERNKMCGWANLNPDKFPITISIWISFAELYQEFHDQSIPNLNIKHSVPGDLPFLIINPVFVCHYIFSPFSFQRNLLLWEEFMKTLQCLEFWNH